MRAPNYLPSKQFLIISVSLLLSAGLVYAADSVTKPASTPAYAVATTGATINTANPDWQSALQDIQNNDDSPAPAAPDQNTVDAMLKAAQSSNLTTTISRSLLINLANAKAQGLGDDIPTQDQLVKTALSQINAVAPDKQYTQEDLTIGDSSSMALHDYGNAMMRIFLADSDQEYAKTLVIIDAATTQNEASALDKLTPIQKKYQTIVNSLVHVTVPKTMMPFHLEMLNDYAKITATYTGMQTLISDPINGLTSIQQYSTLTQDAGKMFINIAQALGKNGILFNKNEPGATWALLLQGNSTP